MKEDLQEKMQRLMYALIKNAARYSYKEFLEELEISEDDYKEIKKIWAEKLNIEPYI